MKGSRSGSLTQQAKPLGCFQLSSCHAMAICQFSAYSLGVPMLLSDGKRVTLNGKMETSPCFYWMAEQYELLRNKQMNASSKATFTKMEVIFSFNNRKPFWSVDTDLSLQFRDKQLKVILHSTMMLFCLAGKSSEFIYIHQKKLFPMQSVIMRLKVQITYNPFTMSS